MHNQAANTNRGKLYTGNVIYLGRNAIRIQVIIPLSNKIILFFCEIHFMNLDVGHKS